MYIQFTIELYRAHLLRKVNITSINDIDETVVDAIISGSQSWKKSSGHVFEDYVCRTTKERLSQYNIRFVLQKDLTQMLQDGQIANDPSDDIEAIARSDNFDIYAIVKYSLQGTTQGRYLTGGVPPVRFSM